MKKSIIYIGLVVIALAPLKTTHAATISAKQIGGSNSSIVGIYVDTENEKINALEGSVIVSPGAADILSFNTGGSAFSLWPTKPSLNKQTISFVGGVPNGISGKDLLLFSIVFSNTKNKKVSIKYDGLTAYKNDGSGTTLNIKSQPADFTITASSTNTLADIILEDKTPPLPFNIELGRDSSIFDGKYFISFATTDIESGINRYEVKEDDGQAVRSGSPYILRNQDLKGTVTVVAVDNAGNLRIETLNLNKSPSLLLEILSVILFGVVFYTIFKFIK